MLPKDLEEQRKSFLLHFKRTHLEASFFSLQGYSILLSHSVSKTIIAAQTHVNLFLTMKLLDRSQTKSWICKNFRSYLYIFLFSVGKMTLLIQFLFLPYTQGRSHRGWQLPPTQQKALPLTHPPSFKSILVLLLTNIKTSSIQPSLSNAKMKEAIFL